MANDSMDVLPGSTRSITSPIGAPPMSTSSRTQAQSSTSRNCRLKEALKASEHFGLRYPIADTIRSEMISLPHFCGMVRTIRHSGLSISVKEMRHDGEHLPNRRQEQFYGSQRDGRSQYTNRQLVILCSPTHQKYNCRSSNQKTPRPDGGVALFERLPYACTV